jgi:hypothetical protein
MSTPVQSANPPLAKPLPPSLKVPWPDQTAQQGAEGLVPFSLQPTPNPRGIPATVQNSVNENRFVPKHIKDCKRKPAGQEAVILFVGAAMDAAIIQCLKKD